MSSLFSLHFFLLYYFCICRERRNLTIINMALLLIYRLQYKKITAINLVENNYRLGQ